MKMPVWAGALLLASAAWGQPPSLFPPELQQYLQLTEQQMIAINRANREFDEWQSEENTRISTVQGEIAEETAKSPLDPMSLGIRYAEVEAICREVRERYENTRKANLSVLTDAQRVKFKVLEDAVKLLQVIGGAEQVNLMPNQTGLGSTNPAIFGLLTSPRAALSPVGCYYPIRWIETPDFRDR